MNLTRSGKIEDLAKGVCEDDMQNIPACKGQSMPGHTISCMTEKMDEIKVSSTGGRGLEDRLSVLSLAIVNDIIVIITITVITIVIDIIYCYYYSFINILLVVG